MTRFVLASKSPARLATLKAAGLSPDVIVSGVDESDVVADTPAQLTVTLARLKAEAVAAQIGDVGDTIILGCDSVLEFDGVAHGKPGTTQAAVDLWHKLRGGTGVLHTGHHIVVVGSLRSSTPLNRLGLTSEFAGSGLNRVGSSLRSSTPLNRLGHASELAGSRLNRVSGGNRRDATRVASTVVRFADLTDEEIQAYADTGEPAHVAGGFTIDGYGGAYVTSIEGDPHNVVGVSLPLVRAMLADLGVSWHSLWRPGDPSREARPGAM